MWKTQVWTTSSRRQSLPKIKYFQQDKKKRSWRNNSLISFRRSKKHKNMKNTITNKLPDFTPNISRVYYKKFKSKVHFTKKFK